MSSGQKKRVSFARALLREPQLLIMDEPLTNLDNKNRKKLQSLIKFLRDRKKSIILQSTNQQDDEIAILSNKKFIIKNNLFKEL